MARVLGRAVLAAAAFWLGLALLPRLSWSADASLVPRIAILGVIGIANGLLPEVLDRGTRWRDWRRTVVAATALNLGLVVAIAVLSAAVGRGVRILGRGANPLELAILLVLAAASPRRRSWPRSRSMSVALARGRRAAFATTPGDASIGGSPSSSSSCCRARPA